MTNTNKQTVAETKDRHGCTVWIMFDPKWDEYWWTLDKESFEGPFDTREDAEANLATA